MIAFFRKQLPEAGWEVVSEEAYGNFKATQNNQTVDVWVGHEAGKPVSILVRLEL